MLGELVPCGGGDPIPLLKDNLLVGRRSRCDIALQFPNVSSHHCELELIDGYWHVRDMRSRNGIKVNGVRCEAKWLMPGDVLSVAKHRYELVYTPSGDGPPPEDVEEEDIFARSLMEKAGLERRESVPDIPDSVRRSRQSEEQPEQNSESPAKTDDDSATDWLEEETGES